MEALCVVGTAASIASLLDVTFKIAIGLNNIITSFKEAPKEVKTAISSITQMRIVLVSVQALLVDLEQIQPSRKSMIELDHLVIVLTQSTISFLALQTVLDPFSRKKVIGPGAQIEFTLRWMRAKNKVANLLEDLERHKASFSLLLAVLGSKSDLEASTAQSQFSRVMDQVLQQDRDIQDRLAQIESNCAFAGPSTKFLEDNGDNAAPQVLEPAPQYVETVSDDHPMLDLSDSFLREFEIVLGTTRVYRRVDNNECDVSFCESGVRTHAWSILSGLTLTDISCISVLGLPFSILEAHQLCGLEAFSSPVRDYLRPCDHSSPSGGTGVHENVRMYSLVAMKRAARRAALESTDYDLWKPSSATIQPSHPSSDISSLRYSPMGLKRAARRVAQEPGDSVLQRSASASPSYPSRSLDDRGGQENAQSYSAIGLKRAVRRAATDTPKTRVFRNSP